jgi:hypothetical protein
MINKAVLDKLLTKGRGHMPSETREKILAGCYAIMETKASTGTKFSLSDISREFVKKNPELVKTNEPYKNVWVVLKADLKEKGFIVPDKTE